MDELPTQDPPIQAKPPYGIILGKLRSGKVVPFLGAAASRVGFKHGDPTYLPSGKVLAEQLADTANFPSNDAYDREDLAKVSSYYVDVSSRDSLREELRKVFVKDQYRCNDLHRFLARVADRLMVVTTNYDTLLEQAFREAGKAYDLVVYPADNAEYANSVLWWSHGQEKPNKLKPNEIDSADFGKTNVIFKMHGTVRAESNEWDSFVITEEDYVKFLSRISNAVPSAFRRYFATRPFLFLGYGLRDWNLRVLLKQVSVSKEVSSAIMKGASVFERTLWERRNVVLYDVTLEEFLSEMQKWLER
jgi:hypothetical protein